VSKVREAVELNGGTVVVYENNAVEVFVQGGPRVPWRRTQPVIDVDGHYDRERAMYEAETVVKTVRDAHDAGFFEL